MAVNELTNEALNLISAREQQVLSVMLENYAGTQVDLNGLTDEGKEQKLEAATQAVKILATSLGAKGLLQNMLATQLLGIHELQQKLVPYASRSAHSPEKNQYFINAITKLSNSFVQQVSLLQKLQGQSQQKMVVEHLHINQGGKAIVGQINANDRGDGW